jgi:hypothetical protein
MNASQHMKKFVTYSEVLKQIIHYIHTVYHYYKTARVEWCKDALHSIFIHLAY